MEKPVPEMVSSWLEPMLAGAALIKVGVEAVAKVYVQVGSALAE